jgi:hypothetical protein
LSTVTNASIGASTKFGTALALPVGLVPTVALADVNGNLVATTNNGDGTSSLQTNPISSITAATVANVASSASNGTVFATATNVHGRTVFNDSTAVLYLKFGATASTSSYTVQIAAAGYYEFPQPVYAGQVDGIWASANGNARVTSW